MAGRRQKRWGEPNPPAAGRPGPQGEPGPAGDGGGVTDHGALTGKGDDDHPQYLTAARGDARYDALGAAAAASAGDRDRANHTGTQLAATVSDFGAAADARIALQRGAASGLAELDSSGLVPTNRLPALAITSVFAAANEAAQLALAAQEGDVAIRSDLNQSYIKNAGTAGTMADWSLLLTPTDAVLSVAGRTGAVVLAKADVGLGSVDNTSDANKPVSTAQQTALDLKLDDSQASVFGLSLLDDADAAAGRTTLGLGTAATTAAADYATAAQGAKADTAMQPATRKTLAATHANSTTTLATITDGTTPWDIPVVAGKTYRVTVIGAHYPAVGTTGIRIAVFGSGGADGKIRGSIYASEEQSSVATELKAVLSFITGGGGAQILTSNGTASATSPNPHGMDFIFICTTSGTLSIQFASEVAASAVTILDGSTLLIQEF